MLRMQLNAVKIRFIYRCVCLSFLLGGSFSFAWAQFENKTSKRLLQIGDLEKVVQDQESGGFQLGLESSSYVSWKNRPDNDRNPYGVTFALDKSFAVKSVEVGISGHAYFSTNQPLLNYSHVDELYVGLKNFMGADEVKIGRYRQVWSTMDSFWRLGAWQPLFLWNYVKPEEQGLAGLFLRWKPANYTIDVFASAFFIPSQGPSFVLRNGNFESSSPWFSIPTQQIVIGSGRAVVKYNLHTPEVSDIVMNPSLGFNIRRDSNKDQSWWMAGAAFKPVNHLGMGLKDNLRISTSELNVELYPYVQYHLLASAEFGYRMKKSDAILGVVGDFPKDVSLADDQSGVQFQRSIMISPMYMYHFNSENLKSMTVSYIYRDTSEVNYIGDVQVASAAHGADRYLFKNAASLAFNGLILNKFPLYLNMRSAYDFSLKGVLVTGEINYRPSANWSLTMGMETIGVDAGDNFIEPRNAFAQYRLNDRVYGGINYVF